jgi:hypothetical protein
VKRLLLPCFVAGIIATTGTGCALVFDDRCGERQRDISATGRVLNANDPEAGFIQLTLGERETTEPRQSGYWLFIDESLRGHVTAARLRGSDGKLLTELDLQLTQAGQQVTYRGDIRAPTTPVTFSDLYELVGLGSVTIVLRTDLADRDSLSTRLRFSGGNPWDRPHCS